MRRFGRMAVGMAMVLGATGAPATGAPALRTAFTSDRVLNAVTVSDGGRVFVSFPYWGGGDRPGPSVTELRPDGTPHAYPDEAWNNWLSSHDDAHAFVRVNAIRIGPDGRLWIVDSGEANVGGQENSPTGAKPKLVVIDLGTNGVVKTIPLDRGVTSRSYVDDLRFHDHMLYLTDAGDPALIVVDQKTGTIRRVLSHAPSTTDERPMLAEGRVLTTGGKPARIHADQLETSPDGKRLYFQASSGPLYVVPTAALDDAGLSETELEKRVRPFCDTPTTGGTAIDGDGNLYVSDVDKLRILKITPQGRAHVLVADPRLVWADAMWIDNRGTLWIPAVQLDRTATFQPDGKSRVHLPVAIYTMDLHLKPSR